MGLWLQLVERKSNIVRKFILAPSTSTCMPPTAVVFSDAENASLHFRSIRIANTWRDWCSIRAANEGYHTPDSFSESTVYFETEKRGMRSLRVCPNEGYLELNEIEKKKKKENIIDVRESKTNQYRTLIVTTSSHALICIQPWRTIGWMCSDA